MPLRQQPEKLEARLREIPAEPGVYLMRDRHDGILYVGKSKCLRQRVRSYFRPKAEHSPRIAAMVELVEDIEFIATDTEAEALALEDNLIKKHQPYYNVLLKDDKQYPYVCITWSETYPRIFITRRRRAGEARDRYYGPYVDAGALRRTLAILKRVFPLRQRPRPLYKDRPCLNYHIGLCPGVCQGLISAEDYRQTVRRIAAIFQGRTQEPIAEMEREMAIAAENLAFEKAALLRDRIATLQRLGADRKVSLPDDTVSRDAIALAADAERACIQLFQIRAGKLVGRLAFTAPGGSAPGALLQRVLEEHYQTCEPLEIPNEIHTQYPLPEAEILAAWLKEKRGSKVEMATPQRQQKAELIELVERNARYELERLQRQRDRDRQSLEDLMVLLDLPDLPRRIECYDISHLQGSDAVGSQVVFIDGVPAKQHYRHYNIKNPKVHNGRSDDFASLAEVLGRRFRKYAGQPHPDDPDFPDVVAIDGGKGQLSSVIAILEKLELDESLTVISLAKKREEIFLPHQSQPLRTDPEQPGVQLLRRLRDEAHRFAISFHRQKRSQRLKTSYLDRIPGLGHYRQKQLLSRFHSLDYLRQATAAQIAETPGIGPKLAEIVYQHFHPQNTVAEDVADPGIPVY